MSIAAPFWKSKSLQDMNRSEWESLCDGCAKCCVYKLQDVDDGRVYYTDVACRLLDSDTCRCTDYAQRRERVPDCLVLDVKKLRETDWLPTTCAYRLLAERKDLPDWHPLLSGNADSAVRGGHSVRRRVISEDQAGELEHHILENPW